MNSSKTLILIGIVLLLGAGLVLALPQQNPQPNRNQEARQVVSQNNQTNWQHWRHQMMYQDMNGDGINDFYRDHDGDGVPNCQDPDWERPHDGTGYQNRLGPHHGQPKHGQQASFRNGHQGHGPTMGHRGNFRQFGSAKSFSNRAFRQGGGLFGSGLCDGTGPKGMTRRGRR